MPQTLIHIYVSLDLDSPGLDPLWMLPTFRSNSEHHDPLAQMPGLDFTMSAGLITAGQPYKSLDVTLFIVTVPRLPSAQAAGWGVYWGHIAGEDPQVTLCVHHGPECGPVCVGVPTTATAADVRGWI